MSSCLTPTFCRERGRCTMPARCDGAIPIATAFAAFVIRHERTCRSCSARVTSECLGGAEPPVRDPYFRCYSCRFGERASGSFAELAELVSAEAEPQLDLLAEASSDRTETLPLPTNEKGRREGRPRKSFGEESRGSLSSRSDNLNPEVGVSYA